MNEIIIDGMGNSIRRTAITIGNIQPVVDLVCNAVTSHHTKRAYERALTEFVAWYGSTGQQTITKATVQGYITALRTANVGAGSINQRLAAIRKLANEMADNGLIDEAAAQAIGRVEGARKEGKRLGNWLTVDQAGKLLSLPNTGTIKGLRDRAILAALLGCGLRREECAGLTLEHIQMREARWVVVDLVGKRNKTRSVPMPSWAKAAIDSYIATAGITEGILFRSVRRGDHIQADGMSAQAIFNVVTAYAEQIGVDVRPHDLRRTFAKLAHKGKAPIEQIQLSLGHGSVQTTERYLGVQQDLSSAPCDALGIKVDV